MPARSAIRIFYAYVLKTEAILAGICLLLMVCLVFISGVARMAGHPLNWAIEISTCLFAWGCFLSADVAWRKDKHMTIDVVVHYLPPAAKRILVCVNYVIISVFLVYVIVFGTWLAWVTRARHFTGLPDLSYTWVTMSFPIAGILLLITTLLKFRDILIEALESAPRSQRSQRDRLRRIQKE